MVPTGNSAPLANPAVCAILDPEQLSSEVGSVQVATAPQAPLSLFNDIVDGRETILGSVTSTTVTVAVQPAAFPLVSITKRETVLAPRSPQSKLDTVAFKEAIPQLSVEPPSISAAVIETVPFASSCTVIS